MKIFSLLLMCCLWAPATLSAQNHKEAQKELLSGLALEYRAEGPPDYKGAQMHYENAAAAGSREALLALARLARPGSQAENTIIDYALRLQKASRAGWVEAAFELGQLLENNPEVKAEMPPASYYFQGAAAGHPGAARRLGEMYLNGEGGLVQDEKQGILWLTVAAENFDPGAAETLGLFFYQKNPEVAMRWLAHADTAEAAYWLGEAYLLEGRKVEAMARLTQAADQDFPPAHLSLGKLNLTSDFGRKANPRAALRHFKIAAQAYLPEACYHLAQMYLTGQATPKDTITGAFWLYQAAALGYEKARPEYETWRYNLTEGQLKRLERMIEEKVAPTTQTPVQ